MNAVAVGSSVGAPPNTILVSWCAHRRMQDVRRPIDRPGLEPARGYSCAYRERAVSQQPDLSQARWFLSLAYHHGRSYSQAIEVLGPIVEADPTAVCCDRAWPEMEMGIRPCSTTAAEWVDYLRLQIK